MRKDSPLLLAIIGTVAIHTLLYIGADAIDVLSPPQPPELAPQLELFEIVMPPPPPLPETPPPPAAQPEPPPVAAPEPVRPAVTRPTRPATIPAPATPPLSENSTPPTDLPPDAAGGGAPVYAMADLGPAARGVAVASGTPPTGKTGRGGAGDGTGTGTGTGDGAGAAPLAVSIAAIKTRAMPKGDYSYFDEYPDEAKRLGIAGQIKVRLLVSAEGAVVKRTLLQGLGHGLDELALKKAATMQFTPARDANDRAVASVVVWTFNMQLQ